MPIARTLGSLTLGLLLSAAVIGAASAEPARLVIPHPTVAAGQAYSPHAVVAKLAQARFKVLELYRKGQAYAILAIGPTGNKVQMTVDGASGTIVGMAIIRRAHRAARPAAPHRPPAGHAPPPAPLPPAAPTQTAANAPRPAPAAARPAPVAPRPASGQAHAAPPHNNNRPAARYADDTKPFGAVIPVAAFRAWTAYKESDWRKPAPPTIPVTYSYAPYREAMPSTYYVALPNQDAFPVAPPNYTPYDVYDPTGTSLVNAALDAADDAEYRAALANAAANYEAARADLADANNAALVNANTDLALENAALRDQLDTINNQPLPPPIPPLDDYSIAPAPGEDLTAIPDVPEPTADIAPTDDTVAPPDDGLGGGAPGPDNTVAPTDGTGGDNNVAPPDNNGGDNNVAPPDNNGGDNNVAPPDSNGGDNNVAPPDNNGGDNNVAPPDNNGGDNNVAPPDNNGGDNNIAPPDNNGGDNNVAPPDNNGGDNDVAPPHNNGGDNGDNNVAPPDNNGGDNGDNNVAPPDNNGGDNNVAPPDNNGGDNGDNNVAPPDNNGGDNGDNNVAPPDNGADNNGGDNGGDNNGGDNNGDGQ